MVAARVGAADVIGLGMAKLALDRVGVPVTLLIQQGARHGAETVGGHRGAVETHSPQREVDRVFAHGPVALALGGEEEAAVAGDLAQLFQDGEDLTAERHTVRDAHLGLVGGDGPDVAGKVELAPFSLPQFARTHENIGGKPQRRMGNRIA